MLAELESFATASPLYTFELVNSFSAVKPSRRKAAVWVTINVTGVPVAQYELANRESVVRFDWRWGREGWKCVQQKSLRGSAAFGGFV